MKKLLAWAQEAHQNHQERHRPSGFQFCHADRIDFVNLADWCQVVGNQLFFSPDYLRVVEQHPPQGLTPHYTLIYRQGRPVAALAQQFLSLDAEQAMGNSEGPLRAARKLASLARPRVLVCGNLMSWGNHGLALHPASAPDEVLPAVAEALYRARRADRLHGQTDLVLIKDFPVNVEHKSPLERFSYRPVETDPDMVLHLPEHWKSHADYLAEMTGKYRKAARQTLQQFETEGLRVTFTGDIAAKAPAIHSLYLQVLANAPFRPVQLSPHFLPGLAASLGDNFRCVLIERQERLLGFVSLLRDGDSAIAYYIGFDREEAAQLPLYLRLLHGAIEQGLAWGVRRISFGRTALEPKARLGCKPEPLCGWVRYRLGAVNWLLKGLWAGVPHDEAPQRSPFKS